MSRQGGVSQWIAEVSSRFGVLTPAQGRILAYWSYGMVLTQSCGLTTVATFLATLLGTTYDAQRQQLREWCYDAADQRGQGRREVDVSVCFAPLLGWVLALWPPGERRLALALDATTLGQRFTVLAISVVYRGCAIPVAWHVVPATTKGKWRPQWERLLRQLGAEVPEDWLVIVLADRGLYARWLFQAIVARKWHPFLRVNQQGHYRPVGQTRFRPLATVVCRGTDGWKGAVDCFASSSCRLTCTLLAQWTEPHTDPWLILTDLPPAGAEAAWYGLRAWIECGFKDCKRGGWDWQQTKMTRPERASRLWLAMAVATLWTVSVGGAVEASADGAALTLDTLTPELCVPLPLPVTPTRRSRPRLLSCFRRGVLHICATLLAGRPLPRGHFVPLPWPMTFPTASPAPARQVA